MNGNGMSTDRQAATERLRQWLARYNLVLVFAAIVVGFSIANPSVFPTATNARTIASTNSVVALLALAAMLPLASGQFDISVGYQLGLAQGLCAGLIINQGLPPAVAVAIVLAAGLVIGLVNGILVAYLKLNSFIATLGSGILVLGVNEVYTKDQQITGLIPASFTNLARETVLGIPLSLVYVLAVCAILWILLEYTAWGRQVFATGGNERAAQLAGVDTRLVSLQCFVLTGLIAALAGVLSVMLLGSSSPVVGLSALLPAFAGAFLGATAIRPGRYNAIGTVIAVYLLATGITGLQQLGAPFYVEEFFNGGALLIAVSFAALVARRRRSGVRVSRLSRPTVETAPAAQVGEPDRAGP
ncbi:MAG TPA: ABC transporter permease [Solirubrobacterales bacterium]|jgi:ribose transport system permease protein